VHNFVLPLLCMMLIAATMYVHFDYRLKWQTASLGQLHPLDRTSKDRELIEWPAAVSENLERAPL